MKCKVISFLMALGLSMISFNVFAGETISVPKNHKVSWGANFSKLDQGDVGYPVDIYGLFADYKYKPLDSIYLNTGISGQSGTLKIKNNGGKMSASVGKFYGNVGYRLAVPAINLPSSVTPYLGFYSFTENNAGKYEESNFRIDFDLKMMSSVAGVSLETQICSKLNVGVDIEYHKISSGISTVEKKINDKHKKSSFDLDKTSAYVVRIPVQLDLSDRLGVLASYQYTGRTIKKMEEAGAGNLHHKFKLNEQEVKLGLIHKF